MSLITDTQKASRMSVLEQESFKDAFGPNKKRKRCVARFCAE